jgi:hypothetical protein
LVVGLLAYWQFAHNRREYRLRKTVVEHPTDMKAWLDLAWHYDDEGTLAADSGDEDNNPPDPTPSYRAALECFKQAVDLGATGFEVQFARAQLADAVGEKRSSVSFGQEALRFAPSPTSSADRKDDINWLHKMIARNAAAPTGLQGREDRERQVRDQRRHRLPRIIRWPLDLIADPSS